MENIRVVKSELLEKIQSNRDSHREQFLEAQTKYRERVIETLDRRLQDARDGRKIDTRINLPEPVDYTEDYDTAIEMLRWEVGDEIEIGEADFQRYVLNKWRWAEVFAANTQSYLG